MKLQNKKKRKQYSHKDIQSMLRDPKRHSQKFSYMHPQISPSGVNFMEDEDSLAVVSDAKRRYISNGWMPNRKVSEAAETKKDMTALMSLEGTLSASIHNAIQGYDMFDSEKGREHLKELRAVKTQAKARSIHTPVPGSEVGMSDAEVGEREYRRSARWDAAGIQTNWGLTPEERDIHADYFQAGMTNQQLMNIQPHLPAHIVRHITKFSNAFRGGLGGGHATSALEAVVEAQNEIIPETNPDKPSVVEDKVQEEEKQSEVATPAKKTRNTKKKQYRAECDTCGIKWKKSWNTKKLKEKLDTYSIENAKLQPETNT